MTKKYKIVTTQEQIRDIETRFKIVSTIDWDLSQFPIKKNGFVFHTNKDKSKTFAEVFTPIYIVDEMIQTIPDGGMTLSTTNLDLCAGYGQFSIRMIRKIFTDNNYFNLDNYLRNHHFFNELQISSCYKLLWIFGSKINLAIGDALELGKLPKKAKGIWFYLKPVDAWINVTGIVKSLFLKYKNGSAYNVKKEEQFVGAFNSIVNRLEYTCEEYKMSIKKIISTKEGRQKLLSVINDAADGIEVNWQDKLTPEWVVREMVNTIPDLNKLKKILVLFNIEFLECLVREKKINPKKIDFGYDSELEGLYAQSIYKVNTFSIGKSFDKMVENTKDKVNYDVVFSNPPYQIMDEGFKASASPIYNKIIEYTIDELNPRYLSMITPSRWMAGGKGLNDFRKRMLQDKRLKLIQDFPGNTVFPTVSIQGGVNYFLWDKDYNGLCDFNGIHRDISEFDVLVRDNTAHQILKKILSKTTTFCNEKVLPRKPFGLPTNFNDWVPEGTPGAVKCYCPIKHGFKKWVAADNFTDKHGVGYKWKVLTGRATYEGSSFSGGKRQIFTKVFVGEKGSICLETYIVTGSFNTKKEAENYANYMHTKFYRFMLSLRVISQDVNQKKFSWVPDLQNYSKAWTDQELYQHFGLTKKEIDHIEKTIKALD